MGRHVLFFVLAWGLVSVTADIDFAGVEASDVTYPWPASGLELDTADNAGATRHRRDRIYGRADWPFDQQLPSFIQSLTKLPWFSVPWYSFSPEPRPAPAVAPSPSPSLAPAPAPPRLQSDVSALERAVAELRASVERLHRRQNALLAVLRCASTRAPSCSRAHVSDRRAQGPVSTLEADDFDWLLAGLPAAAPPASVPLPVTSLPVVDQRGGFSAPSYGGYGPAQGYGPGIGFNQGYGASPGQGYNPGVGYGTGQGYPQGQGFVQGFNPGQAYGFGVPQANPNTYHPDLFPNRSGAPNQATNTVTLPIPNGLVNTAANVLPSVAANVIPSGESALFRPAGGSPVFQGTSTSSSSSTGPGGTIFTSTSEQTGVDASGKPTFSSVTASGDGAGHVVVTTSGSDKEEAAKA